MVGLEIQYLLVAAAAVAAAAAAAAVVAAASLEKVAHTWVWCQISIREMVAILWVTTNCGDLQGILRLLFVNEKSFMEFQNKCKV